MLSSRGDNCRPFVSSLSKALRRVTPLLTCCLTLKRVPGMYSVSKRAPPAACCLYLFVLHRACLQTKTESSERWVQSVSPPEGPEQKKRDWPHVREGQPIIVALVDGPHTKRTQTHFMVNRRPTIEVHPNFSESPPLRSSTPHPNTDLRKNQIASRRRINPRTQVYKTLFFFEIKIDMNDDDLGSSNTVFQKQNNS